MIVSITTIALAALTNLLALIALMALFMGSENTDLIGLLQILRLQIVVLTILAALCAFQQYQSDRSSITDLWRRVPGWLRAVTAMMWLLAALAELSIYLVERISGETVAAVNYVPVVALIVSTITLCTAYVRHRFLLDLELHAHAPDRS